MLNIIVNPIAGGKSGRKIKKTLSTVEKYLQKNKIEYKVFPSKYKGHAQILTDEVINSGADNIIVMGGDGTIHEVINGFSNFDNVSLGIIPCGTGNDFVSSLNIPLDPITALEIILNGNTKFVDYMQMPTVRGINIIGMGIDVDVLVKYSKLKNKNKLGYAWCLIKTLMNFEYSNFKATVDGVEKEYCSFIAAIANGKQYGGGIEICPPANPLDSNMDFLVVNQIPKNKILGKLIKLLGGKIMSFPETEHITCKKIKIETPTPYTIQVDGELYNDIPFEVELISNQLKVFVN